MSELQRGVLPIPDRTARRGHDVRRQGPRHVVPAYRASPTASRGAERARDPDRRCRFRLVVGIRRTVPDAELRAAGGERAPVQPLPHDGAVLADAGSPPERAKPPRRRDGRHHRDRDLGAGIQLDPAEGCGPARRDAQAERLLDRAVRQVPRGSGLGDEPDGAVRRVAHRQRLRALLRLHRRGDEPVRPGHLPRHRAGRARSDPRTGLPLHRGHDRPHDPVGARAEGPDAGQAVLRLLRAGRDTRPAPRSRGVVGEVQGQVRPGLGPGPRGDASRGRRS